MALPLGVLRHGFGLSGNRVPDQDVRCFHAVHLAAHPWLYNMEATHALIQLVWWDFHLQKEHKASCVKYAGSSVEGFHCVYGADAF